MAKIAIVTLTTSHGTVANTKAMLEGLGHTVSVMLSSAATHSLLITFDLIVSVRGEDNATYSSVIAGAVMAGIPLICGFPGTTTALATPMHSLRLVAGSISSSFETTQLKIRVNIAHPYTNGLADASGDIFIYPSNTYAIAIASSQIISTVAILANTPSSANRHSMLLAKKGTLNFDDQYIGADVAYYSFCYGLNGYTENAKTMFARTIVDFTTVKKSISGNVIDSNGNPAQRMVYAVNLTTNIVDDHVMSDVSGNYLLKLPDTSQHAVFCVDDIAEPLILVG